MIELALRPVETDVGLIDAAGDFPPEPALDYGFDEQSVVALPDVYFAPRIRSAFLVLDV